MDTLAQVQAFHAALLLGQHLTIRGDYGPEGCVVVNAGPGLTAEFLVEDPHLVEWVGVHIEPHMRAMTSPFSPLYEGKHPTGGTVTVRGMDGRNLLLRSHREPAHG